MSRSNNATLLLNWLILKWCTRYQKFVPRHRNQWFHIQLCHFYQMVHSANCSYHRHHDENLTTNDVTGTIFLHRLQLGVWQTDRQACDQQKDQTTVIIQTVRTYLSKCDILPAELLATSDFWDVKQWHWARSSQHFKGSYCLQFQGQRVQEENVILLWLLQSKKKM